MVVDVVSGQAGLDFAWQVGVACGWKAALVEHGASSLSCRPQAHCPSSLAIALATPAP
jgi:hypothetical protein